MNLDMTSALFAVVTRAWKRRMMAGRKSLAVQYGLWQAIRFALKGGMLGGGEREARLSSSDFGTFLRWNLEKSSTVEDAQGMPRSPHEPGHKERLKAAWEALPHGLKELAEIADVAFYKAFENKTVPIEEGHRCIFPQVSVGYSLYAPEFKCRKCGQKWQYSYQLKVWQHK